jgi:hypothetical protein
MVVAVCWAIGIFAIVERSRASASIAGAAIAILVLTGAAGVAFWVIRRASAASSL